MLTTLFVAHYVSRSRTPRGHRWICGGGGSCPVPSAAAMPTPLGRNSHRRQPSHPPHQHQQQQHCRCCTLAGNIASTLYPASPLYTADPDRYGADACATCSCCPGTHRLVPRGGSSAADASPRGTAARTVCRCHAHCYRPPCSAAASSPESMTDISEEECV